MSNNLGSNVRQAVPGKTPTELGWPKVGTVIGNLHDLDNVVIRNLRSQYGDLYLCNNCVFRTSGQGAGMANPASCGAPITLGPPTTPSDPMSS